MLTLDQVRAVNDGFKASDFVAALRPLEESIDLRPAEMPRLEKSSQAAFKNALQTPEIAEYWAETLFHPNISVRRFTRKLLLGLKEDAKPIAAPLRARIARFLETERLLGWSDKWQEAAKRREQVDMLQSAIELLLRAEVDEWMAAFTDLSQKAQPFSFQRSAEQAEFQKQWQQAHVVLNSKTDELYVLEWGAEMRDPIKRNDLPSRAHREIAAKLQETKEWKAVQELSARSPWLSSTQDEAAANAMHWQQARQIFTSSLSPYIGYNPSTTQPAQKVAARIRVHLWKWLEAVLSENDTKAAQLLTQSSFSYYFYQSLGTEELWTRAPRLLHESKSRLQTQLSKLGSNYWGDNPTVAGIWVMLAMAFARSIENHRGKKEQVALPENLTAEALRDLKVDHLKYLNSSLEQAIRVLESRNASKKAQEKTVENPRNTVGTPAVEPAVNEEKRVVFAGEPIADVEARVTSESEIQRRVQQLIDGTNDKYPRLRGDIWQRWEYLPGWDKVKQRIWSLAEPQLWERLEKHISDYRSISAGEPPASVANKLTENEIKKWKSSSRRRLKDEILRDFESLAFFMVQRKGITAMTKLLEMTSRPGTKEFLQKIQTNILQHVQHSAPAIQTVQSAGEQKLQKWFLEPEWQSVLDCILPDVLAGKARPQYYHALWTFNALAVGYYRLGNEEGRVRCRELLPKTEGLAYNLAPVVRALRDVETWLLLLHNLQWPHPDLEGLWDDLIADGKTSEVLPQLLNVLMTTSNERSVKLLLNMIGKVSPEELQAQSDYFIQAIESPLPAVIRWGMNELSKIPNADNDWETPLQIAGEKLWSENGALAKEAAKFLGTIGAKNTQYGSSAWEKLAEATTLENVSLSEAVFRSLVKIRAQNPDFVLDESAAARLEELTLAQSERFSRLQKKLAS